ncbi:MAG TPA: hypothetical protein VK985_09520 [Rariglobus sp.]|nr:hypothetical protein [Rariglobus sp.]
MTATERSHHLQRAVVKTLREVGGRLVPVDAVVASVGIKADYLEPTRAEIFDAIAVVESRDRILGMTTETGKKYKITEAGEAWALEVKL